MDLIDVNILVQAHREDADQHLAVNSWLESVLREAGGLAVSELVLSGFLRVVTHPKVFKRPTPLGDALAFVSDFRERDSVIIARPGSRNWEVFEELVRKADARGNRIPDAYHAALAVEQGFEWVTLDRGFGRYPNLRWRHPLD